MAELRHTLTDEEFRTLVEGGEARITVSHGRPIEEVVLILDDIGWERMRFHIEAAASQQRERF